MSTAIRMRRGMLLMRRPHARLAAHGLFHCCCWRLVSSLLLAMASAGLTAEPTIDPIIAPEPIVVRVTSTAAPREYKGEVLVTTDGLPAQFQDVSVMWAPERNQSPLVSITDPARQINFWEDPKSRSVLEFEFSRAHLRSGRDPVRITVRIGDPRDLTAGIYEGFLRATMRLAVTPDVAVEYQWPLIVIVEGRFISTVAFSHGQAAKETLTVGTPASVTIAVDTVGDDNLGVGTVELGMSTMVGRTSSYEPLLRSPPLPCSEPLDCVVDLGKTEVSAHCETGETMWSTRERFPQGMR